MNAKLEATSKINELTEVNIRVQMFILWMIILFGSKFHKSYVFNLLSVLQVATHHSQK